MKYQTQRALFYTFATQEIECGSVIEAWRLIAELFGVSEEERQWGEKLLSDPMLARLKTAEDVRLLRKCASGFGNGLQRLTEGLDDEFLELKHQAILKVRQLTSEQRATPLKAVASAYPHDPTAAVLYALQILLRNKKRRELGYRILSEALSADQSSDAGIVLLSCRQGNAGIFVKLAETPEMILHPDVLEELAQVHGIDLATVQKTDRRIGF